MVLARTNQPPCAVGRCAVLVEHLQALLRDLVGSHVVDADLQVIQSGAIQLPNPVAAQQIPVRDHGRDHATRADPSDEQVQIGMQEWLTATERDDAGSEIGEEVDPS